MLHMIPHSATSSLRKLTLFLTFIFITLIAAAQEKTITGVVTDTAGAPLPGVSIMIQKTKIGTTTDLNGHYSLKAAVGATIVFTYTSGATASIRISSSQDEYDVRLAPPATSLNDVVVVGYGRQKKVNLVGAVGTVNVDEKMTGRA